MLLYELALELNHVFESFLVMMIYQNGMILEKGEESMSYEFWQEPELNLLIMLMMRLATFRVMKMLMLVKKMIVVLIWNITNK